MSKEAKAPACIFCKNKLFMKQPTIKMPVVIYDDVPMCEYHFRLYKDWATDAEWDEMRDIIKKWRKKNV